MLLPPQDEIFRLYYASASDHDFSKVYYRNTFDFGHNMIDHLMLHAPDPLLEPIRCQFLREGGLIENYAAKGPELAHCKTMNLV